MYRFSASEADVPASTSFCHALCLALPYVADGVSGRADARNTSSRRGGLVWEASSYLQIEHSWRRGFGDVFAIGNLEESVEL